MKQANKQTKKKKTWTTHEKDMAAVFFPAEIPLALLVHIWYLLV